MRKVMLMAAVMAMVLAAAAPAFAQANAVGGSVQYVDCDQIQAAATGQYNVGNDQDQAGIAQELGVSQNQVSACLDSIAAGEDVNINDDDGSAAATTYAKKKDKKSYAAPKKASVAPKKVYAAPKQEATATATVKAASSAASAPASAPAELPSTGGPPALALGAAVLLLAGGLLARRIVR